MDSTRNPFCVLFFLFFTFTLISYARTKEDFIVIEASDSFREDRDVSLSQISSEYDFKQVDKAPSEPPPLYQPCQTTFGDIGRCTGLKECYPYFKIHELSGTETWVMGVQDACSYDLPQGGKRIFGICCVKDSNNSTSGDLAAIAVDEEEEETGETSTEGSGNFEPALAENEDYDSFICGTRTRNDNSVKIVNGNEAEAHEFPFMAALMNQGRQFCGGSLIDSTHVLTAAHCVAHMTKEDVRELRVRLGDHNILNDDDVQHLSVRVQRVVRHKSFSGSTLYNDVALLTLANPVAFTSTIQPICLARDDSVKYVNREVTVAGWGTLRDGGKQSSVLQKVNVDVWKNDDCDKSYGSNAPGGIVSHMLCASKPGKDSCSGDSGGPLFYCDETCSQIGIVSWGIGCARQQFPGVYTRVTSLIDWIDKIRRQY